MRRVESEAGREASGGDDGGEDPGDGTPILFVGEAPGGKRRFRFRGQEVVATPRDAPAPTRARTERGLSIAAESTQTRARRRALVAVRKEAQKPRGERARTLERAAEAREAAGGSHRFDVRCERVSPEEHVARFHRSMGQTHHKYCVVCCQMLIDVRLAPRIVCGVDVVREGPGDRAVHVECGTRMSCARAQGSSVRFSFANHMFPVPQFQIFERLSLYERLLVARAHANVWIVRLRLGQLGFKGNAVCFEAKTKEFARRLPNLPGGRFIQCAPAGRRNQHAATKIRLRLIEYAFCLLERFHRYFMDHPENPHGRVVLDSEIMKRLLRDRFADDVEMADAADSGVVSVESDGQAGRGEALKDAGGVRVALTREEAPDFVTHKMWETWATGGTALAEAFTGAALGRQWLQFAWGEDAYAKFESEGVAALHSFACAMKSGYDPANRAKSQMRRFVGRADWSGSGGLEVCVELGFIHLIGCCTVNAAP